MALGALRLNWRTADPATLAALKTAMHADGTDAEFLAGTERVAAATWGQIPRTYIRLTQDTSIPLALQDRFIREADALTPANPFDVYSLDSSHIGFLLHPDEAAAVLGRQSST